MPLKEIEKPVGTLMLVPEHTAGAVVKAGRTLKDSEKLDILPIGVCESARGRGSRLSVGQIFGAQWRPRRPGVRHPGGIGV